MKEIRIIIMLLMALGSQQANAQWGSLLSKAGKSVQKAAKTVRNANAKENTFIYGQHTYTMKGTLTMERYDQQANGTVTFSHVPSDYAEFEAVYTQFLGKTPHGTAAMMPMAMEIYGRDRQVGLQCLKLICYPSNVNSVTSILNTKYGPSTYSPANDPYLQRYLPAAVLRGATPTNGYSPQEPYTVEMKASVNKHQDMQITGSGRVLYLYVMGKGWDTEQRQVEIIRPTGQELHQVFNCPSLYTQCKQIQGTWKGLK